MIGIDHFADRDTRQSCIRVDRIAQDGDVTAILDQHAGLETYLVGGISGGGRLMEHQAASGSDVYPAPEVLDSLADPRRLRRLAAEADWAFPITIDRDALEAGYLPNSLVRWLRKPVGGSGGLGITWVNAASEMPEPDQVFQQWVPGKNYGATLMVDGEHARLLGVCRSTFHRVRVGSNVFPFVYSGSLGPIDCPPDWADCLVRLARTVAGQTGLRGLCNIDFIVDTAGVPWLVEINPRWSGSSELVERGMSDRGRFDDSHPTLFAVARAVSRGQSIAEVLSATEDTSKADRRSAGVSSSVKPRVYRKRVIFARRKTKFIASDFSDRLGKEGELLDLPQDRTVVPAGQPICTVIHPIATSRRRTDRQLRRVATSMRG